MHCLNENAGDLLRKGPVLQGGTASKRFLQLVGDIRTDEYTFTVCHKVGKLLQFSEKNGYTLAE